MCMDDFDNSANTMHKVGSPARQIPTNYASRGRIMLVSVLVLFVALAIVALFHMYTRWLLFGRRSSLVNQRRRRARDLNLAFNDDTTTNSISRGLGQRGLAPSILKSLPTFVYSAASSEGSPECAVCLSEFEEDETGRILPSCKHSFHVDCIDVWFRTHSNCPLCRAPVQNPDGTLVILVQLQPQTLDPSNSHNVVLPTVWSSFKDDRILPELTSISVETLANGDREARGSSAPVSSSGSNGPPANR